MKNEKKSNIYFDSYKSSIDLKNDLSRLKELKDTIDLIIRQIEKYEEKKDLDLNNLKEKIYKLTSNENYVENQECQDLIKQVHNKIEMKKELFKKKEEILEHQLNQFKETYNKLYSKEIFVRCEDLIDELKKLSNSDIYTNLSIGIVSFEYSNLSKIIKEYTDKICCIDMTISDKKNPEYYMEMNNILYSNRYPTNFKEIQYDGKALSNHITLDYGFSDEAKRYTCLKIADISNIRLKLKLGDLTKENLETWKPVELIKEAVFNCKDKEYKKNIEKQKVKRI